MPQDCDLLAIDLDGTLLDGRGRVADVDRDAVRRARAAGVTVVLATGRALVESRVAVDAIEHAGSFIASGGAVLVELPSERTLERRVMSHEVVAESTEVLVEAGHKVLLLKDASLTGYDYLAVGTAPLDPASQWWFEHLPVSVRFAETLADDPDPHETLRVGVVAGSDELASLAGDLEARLDGRAMLQHWAAVTKSAPVGSATHLLEIFDVTVDKWTMIEALCGRLGIDPARTAAIGDGLNDVGMVRGAGVGIAMGNADERVHAVADLVVADHDHGGVAEAIDRLLDARSGIRRGNP